MEDHLAPLPDLNAQSFPQESSSNDDSCVEVTFNVDKNVNELIEWASHLRIRSDSDQDNDENFSST
jgi:hypothetical protein